MISKFRILGVCLALALSFGASAQNQKNSSNPNNLSPAELKLQSEMGIKKLGVYSAEEEKLQREMMKKDGVPAPTIDRIIAERKLLWQKGKYIDWMQVQKQDPTPVPMAPCNGMGAEQGWGAWSGIAGTSGPPTFTGTPVSPPPASNANTCFNILTGAGQDPCTPGAAAGNPPIPNVCPGNGFGASSIQIGCLQTPNCYAEQITYPLTVTPADTNFIYAYAIVVEDPGHDTANQPFVQLCIYDQNGNPVPCGCFKYAGGPNLPGFFTSNNTCPGSYYKPWTIVGVNLGAYVGQTLTVVITNVDCGYCGHFAQSYWDFQCPPVAGTSTPFCAGQSTTLCGPPSDPSNPYNYTWYDANQNPIPGGTTQCITVTPQIGDTFYVNVMPVSGCGFWMPFVPAPTAIQTGFTYSGTCGNMNFAGTATITPTSATNTVTAWAWQFPGGSPASASTQNPGPIIYAPGTYTATLIVTSTAGCKDTFQQSFTVGGFPTAAYQSTPPCLGGQVQLTDGSTFPAGDPITGWNWTMTGGTPSTATTQNTSTTYNSAGTHSVTLVVTTQSGCKDTIVQQVLVYNPPVANFSGSGSGCAPICVSNFTDLSTSADGNIVGWDWVFPGGTPQAYSGQVPPAICYNVPGSYGASIIVTTQYGCKDTIAITPLVTVHPWPTAQFCVMPAQAPVTDPVFTFCDMWSSDVSQWTWHFGDNDSNTTSTDPVHSYSATATNNDFYTYNICLNVKNQFGCWDTVCHIVELIPEFEFYIPNTFTPNTDWINEYFYGKCRGVKEYHIWVFDRWGNQIWDCHAEDKNTNWDSDATTPKQEGLASKCKWDGKVVKGGVDMGGGSNQLAQEDVYVWKVRLVDIFDKKHSYVGHVNIVR